MPSACICSMRAGVIGSMPPGWPTMYPVMRMAPSRFAAARSNADAPS
jgi:hypothetical protein